MKTNQKNCREMFKLALQIIIGIIIPAYVLYPSETELWDHVVFLERETAEHTELIRKAKFSTEADHG